MSQRESPAVALLSGCCSGLANAADPVPRVRPAVDVDLLEQKVESMAKELDALKAQLKQLKAQTAAPGGAQPQAASPEAAPIKTAPESSTATATHRRAKRRDNECSMQDHASPLFLREVAELAMRRVLIHSQSQYGGDRIDQKGGIKCLYTNHYIYIGLTEYRHCTLGARVHARRRLCNNRLTLQ